MENIQKQNKKVNDVDNNKLSFGANAPIEIKKEVNNVHAINESKTKSLLENTIETIKSGLDPFIDQPLIELEASNDEEEKLINEHVEANILKAKIKKATQEKLAKTKPIKPVKQVKVLTEEEIIAKRVQANIIKEKVKLASKTQLEKINPPTPKKEYVKPPTIESIYIDRKMADGKTLFIDDYRRDAGNIFKWEDDHWKVQDPVDIKKEISKWLELNNNTELNNKNVLSIYHVFYYTMDSLDRTPIKDLYIPTKKHWLMVSNDTGEITAIKPNKAIPLTYQINVVVNKAGPYKPKPTDAKSVFSKFINSSLPGTDKQALVQEYCGYTLTTNTQAQKFQFWIGNGGNGKSVLVELLTAINPCSVATQMENIGIYNDNFIGKSLIFASETKKKSFDVEFLKAAVSGDTVELRGIRKEKQSVKMIAKWILLANHDFRIDDFSNGLFRRMIIVNWNVSFENSKEEIKDLSQQILTNELDILLDWCLDGLQRLIKNKLKFTTCEESEKALFNFKNHADKVRMFVNDYPYEYSADKKLYTNKEDIYNKFISYADKNGYEKLNATNFWLRLKNIYPEIDDDIKSDYKKNGKRIVYLNLKQVPL